MKLSPYCRESLWGGNKLEEYYGKPGKGKNIGECWEIAADAKYQSQLASGACKGMSFENFLGLLGKEGLGWKCRDSFCFPLLVKLIDAREALSVQVHPDNRKVLDAEYGTKTVTGGKWEAWHILECEKNSYIYFGWKEHLSENRILKHIEEGTLEEALEKRPVRRGETILVPGGTVHAIGPGILLCEIQQNRDVTYRLYDYNREDELGRKRKLQVDAALSVMEDRPEQKMECYVNKEKEQEIEKVADCPYFRIWKYTVHHNGGIFMDDSSFAAMVVSGGSGVLKDGETKIPFQSGDSFFAAAGNRRLQVEGACEILLAKI